MDTYYNNKIFNFGSDPAQNGQMAAIFDFCYNIMHMAICNIEAPPSKHAENE